MSDSSSHSSSNTQNGQRCHILTIESVQTKLVIAVPNIPQEHGYIRGYRFHPTASNKLQILLKYKNQKPVINKTIRISKPSKRVYISINQLRGAGVPSKERLNDLASSRSNTRLVSGLAPSNASSNEQLPFYGSGSKGSPQSSRTDASLSGRRQPPGFAGQPTQSSHGVAFDHAGRSAASGHQLNSLSFMQGISIPSTSKGI
jgi:small subunit ribosomal protein S8